MPYCTRFQLLPPHSTHFSSLKGADTTHTQYNFRMLFLSQGLIPQKLSLHDIHGSTTHIPSVASHPRYLKLSSLISLVLTLLNW